jgi:hypothetical protein
MCGQLQHMDAAAALLQDCCFWARYGHVIFEKKSLDVDELTFRSCVVHARYQREIRVGHLLLETVHIFICTHACAYILNNNKEKILQHDVEICVLIERMCTLCSMLNCSHLRTSLPCLLSKAVKYVFLPFARIHVASFGSEGPLTLSQTMAPLSLIKRPVWK